MKEQLTGWGLSAGSGLTAAVAGAPWWVGLLAIFAMRLLVLASQRMDYREIYRLARLANSGCVKGHGGIEWTAASPKPPEPEPKQPEPPKPKRWRWRKPPLDSS